MNNMKRINIVKWKRVNEINEAIKKINERSK